MIRVLCFLVLVLPLSARAQFTYVLDNSIPVQHADGEALSLAWVGGLNAAQFNTMDLDGDGLDDLVLFDRMAGKVITFLQGDNGYIPQPDYEGLFPDGVSNWLLLRDYNCDGLKDIFTGDVLGIKVYRNTTPAGGDLSWEQHFFDTGFGTKSPVLMTEGSNNKVNLQLQFDDLPSISDLDGDGDLDILNIQYAGHTIEFHQNFSVENGQPCDSMDFRRITRSWGNFRECSCGVFAFNGEACPPNTGGRTKHAGGKSLLAIDLNGDQQQDLLFSEAECTRIFSLPNEGTSSTDPVLNSFSAFPAPAPVNLVLYPAAYYEDVDFDGKRDLIATPNIFSKEFLNSTLDASTWFYRNTGTDSNPSFTLVQRNFLQEDMIDVGDNAVPAFADADGDGDLDLFISSHSSEDFTSRVFLYENTGTAELASFELFSDDYLGFSGSRFFNVRIQFADMNADQRTDFVFTATHFEQGTTALYYLDNQSATALDFNGGMVSQVPFQMTSSENIYLADISGDGRPDILAGRSEGNLEYWKNNGIDGAPSFVLEEENYLGLESSPLRQNLTSAIADFDGDGTADLALGDQTGQLSIISNFRNPEAWGGEPDRQLVFNQKLGTYTARNLGGKIWPVAVNLFNTNKPSIVVGNGLGGLHILRHDSGTSLPEEPQLHVYPNPALRSDVLKIQPDRYGMLQVISILGQQLSRPVALKANEIYEYQLPPLASGLYLLKFTSGNRSRVERLVVR